ncbi:unnamed protein product [Schistosoma curassoni]|nr:unnamed protein product [Schistosoma curassoni]
MQKIILLLLICFFLYIERIYASVRTIHHYFPKVILISLDGFRYDYFDMAEERSVNMSAFKKIKNRGVYVKRIQNEFPTLTFPSHFSMVTGMHPESHGIVDNVFYDPTNNATFSSRNQSTASDSRFYDVGAEPIWVTNQFHGHKSGVTFWIGSEAKIKGQRPTHYLAPYNENITFNQRIDILMGWFEHENINLGLMYYHQPDRAGHIYGAASDEVFKAIEEINHGLDYLLTSMETRPSLSCCLNLILSSDHGMTNVSSDRVIYLHDYIHPNEYTSAPKKSAEIWTLWPRQENKGSHGYDPDYKDMSPFLMATGPHISINQTTELEETVRLIDIYSLICLILKLKPAPNNGSVCRIARLVIHKSIANVNRSPTIFIIKFVMLTIFMSYNGLYN